MCVSELYSQKTRENLYKMFTNENILTWKTSFLPRSMSIKIGELLNQDKDRTQHSVGANHSNYMSQHAQSSGALHGLQLQQSNLNINSTNAVIYNTNTHHQVPSSQGSGQHFQSTNDQPQQQQHSKQIKFSTGSGKPMDNQEIKKLGIVQDPRKFYLDVGVIRSKFRNASRNIQQKISNEAEQKGAPGIFKVSTSPSNRLFEDNNNKNYHHRAVQSSREHEIKQMRFHKEKLINQILRKYQNKEQLKEKEMKQGKLTARMIVDRMEKIEHRENIKRITQKMKLTDMEQIHLFNPYSSAMLVKENPYSSAEKSLRTSSTSVKYATISTNSKQRSRQPKLNKSKSDNQVKKIMSQCEIFRRQMNVINLDIRDLEDNIDRADVMLKKLELEDEILIAGKDFL
ncbi:UNKNOWN [Stylonychia lemnae]|uniref:Uncharacterized protein n=1 Tax=Stylonychia lemnae TaxID=5949 RepID=A0A077ZNQ7_STYLE|nr:UNKNOWN [Stylonychia lemnae]|eukprot:CDW71602.1 UNKNOWN [Stylonychia lemnae]